MTLSVERKTDASVSENVAVIGDSIAAIQAALTLAQMGVEVNLIAESVALEWDDTASSVLDDVSLDQRFLWPLLLRATSHPLITLYSNARVESVKGKKGDFEIQVVQGPRYIHEDICTSCGRCQTECSVRVTSLLQGQKVTHSAIHAPVAGERTVPSAYVIDKNGFASCRVACPLGINVQGFVSLLAHGKTDEALALISEAAPLNGILGRVCRHPCENSCNRAEVDSPVSIWALHRYAADNAPSGIKYKLKLPARSRDEKIAIVGSGPAGLAAAWELARLGYSPTIFESHGVIGGMLAIGIPRFRLPREVREREIEAIKNLGVDIRTGITVGRDVTFAYLKERGYRAFFLSIGAQRGNRLNIPGEELEGVVDSMSLLLSLNLMVDTFVGSKIVVIGGGDAAVDCARTATRAGAKEVTILYRRTRAEMPAAPEEVEEALYEGISYRINAVPVEILGDGGKVTGIRCQQTESTEQIMPSRRHSPKPLPGTDFVIDADHVVVAIGQSPDASQLNMGGLTSDTKTGVIKVNPLTLETTLPGIFAGGDCITGPNNVVEAMAAGLRAAESIDRYIQGCDLEAGRSLEPLQAADIDIDAMEISPLEREPVPLIQLQKRIKSFEETTTGLSAEAVQRETQRCLNCALCSQCMECTRVCGLDAIFHNDSTRHFEVGARVILRFPPVDLEDNATEVEGVHTVSSGGGDDNLLNQLMKAMGMALGTAMEVKPKKEKESHICDFAEKGRNMDYPCRALEQSADGGKRIGVVLCRCGDGISSIIDFKAVAKELSAFPEVTCVREIVQACTEAGAREIANQVAEEQLDRVVLAACRCCSLDQICYSCTDRRIMCYQFLEQHLISPHNMIVEFVNIREQCAWAHKDDPKGATRKAVQIISSGINHARTVLPMTLGARSILPSALIIGGGLASVTAATALASRGFQVGLVSRQGLEQDRLGLGEMYPLVPEQFHGQEIIVKPWPDSLKLYGSPGNYEAVLEYGSQVDCISTGVLLVDIGELGKEESPLFSSTSRSGILGRIISQANNTAFSSVMGCDLLREITIKETVGIFLLPSGDAELPNDQTMQGLAIAARISAYLEQSGISPRAMAVRIDGKLCRGCGDCADICSYIEMREHENGLVYADIDEALCLGCGACIASCAVGAIIQPLQSDKQIVSALRSMLHPSQTLSGVL